MRALITGATGFLGGFLARRLRAQSWTVDALGSADADLCDPRSLDGYAEHRYDRIFHLAAWTQAGDFCLHHPGEQWLINQQINTTVLNFWATRQPEAKLVSMGTSCAYEEGADLSEDRYLIGTPIADLYTYAMTKRMLLIGQRSLAQQYGLKWLTVVPSTVYGPDYHVGTKQMHFVFDLAWKILRRKHFGDVVTLWGDGHQRRELVYIDDFIETLLRLDATVTNDIVNIGEGADHSIREFAGLIAEAVGVDPAEIRYDTDGYVGARTKCLSVVKLDALLPDRPRTPLKMGLSRMLEWLEPKFLEMAGSKPGSAPPGSSKAQPRVA